MFGQSATAITIIFIIIAAGIGAFVRKRSRDKCLRDFENNMVTLEDKSGKTIWGSLRVENTGLEFVYSEKYRDDDGHDEASYILYKYEYPNIQAVVRFHDELSEKKQEGKRQRARKDLSSRPGAQIKKKDTEYLPNHQGFHRRDY